MGTTKIGITICEDLWHSQPLEVLAKKGCRLVLNLSASPYHAGKSDQRRKLFTEQAKKNRLAIAYCNLVGGQDELVFDGSSLIIDSKASLLGYGFQFKEDLVFADIDASGSTSPAAKNSQYVSLPLRISEKPPVFSIRRCLLSPIEEIYQALVLGTGDYVRKNGFEAVLLGLSGGIDSSLTACIAVDALGKEKVIGVVMPSRFSSEETQADARELAKNLGMRLEELSIEPCFSAYLQTLNNIFSDKKSGITEQNIQARIRGTLLMALSNKFGWLVLTTGNKSEMATGYCTLYGDMAGGFAVIKDVPKTIVYQLAKYRSSKSTKRLIPESIFSRAPTAELAPNQRDQDTLPPYEELDSIIKAYVENDLSLGEMLSGRLFKPNTVKRVIRMIDGSEYKRRQGPPGIKITPKAFGKDRRMPITNRYQQS